MNTAKGWTVSETQNKTAETQNKKSEAYLRAERESKDCKPCRGYGLVTVYARGYPGPPMIERDDGTRQVATRKDGRHYVARTMAHCRCAFGRFLRATWPEDLVERTPDIVEVLNGSSYWSAKDPTAERVDDPGRPVTKEDFAAFWEMVANLSVTKDVENVAGSRRTVWSMQTDYRKRLARELELDERIADSLTLDELLKIKEVRDSWVS